MTIRAQIPPRPHLADEVLWRIHRLSDAEIVAARGQLVASWLQRDPGTLDGHLTVVHDALCRESERRARLAVTR